MMYQTIRGSWLTCVVWSAAICLLPVGALAGDASDPNPPEQAKEIVADQIRAQGRYCERAVKAYRDEARSRPDEPAWILVCSNAAYRIRLRADMSADVEPTPD
jgi:hypothetical protein